jgi:hypothetical protein
MVQVAGLIFRGPSFIDASAHEPTGEKVRFVLKFPWA